MNLAIVTADFNSKITYKMEEVAKKQAVSLGAKIKKTIHVPGAFEIPFAVNKLLKDPEIDGIITLGVVIKGHTDHDQVVANNASKQIMNLSLKYEKPVSLGIIGPNVTRTQAEEKLENYAKRAAEAVIKMLNISY
ncbi:6,7-dimethyl-8-ribityllumazine synthase [Candidatus Woesearchaeota archaeon]|nr:6,7-dimethyl-8-ribityllumazine synthase [Candidatus Woesearchaeota archaeon]